MEKTYQTNQRVAVVTGGAMGIGSKISESLAKKDLMVLVSDINEDAANETVRRLRAEGYSAAPLLMDVGRQESISSAFAQVDKEYGRCDVLVNCAGIATVFPFLDFPIEDFVNTMNVNVTGTLLCSQHAARLMLRNRWGRIVNIASVAGMRAVGTGRTAYGTSKGAVISLTRQMAVELAEYGITANAVAPGPVDTPMTQKLHTAKFRDEYSRAIPMNRYGTMSEIASAVLYLASEEASYITGIVMPVDGGFLSSGARGI